MGKSRKAATHAAAAARLTVINLRSDEPVDGLPFPALPSSGPAAAAAASNYIYARKVSVFSSRRSSEQEDAPHPKRHTNNARSHLKASASCLTSSGSFLTITGATFQGASIQMRRKKENVEGLGGAPYASTRSVCLCEHVFICLF